jgi:quinol-cytochrome oxidoreductase complex cytochrome b subunit
MAYVPTPAEAYDSILFINSEIFFGGFIRNIHHWSGIFFVIITFLHFIRVFYSQAIFVPRRINWIIGMGLLILAILSNFTGYLLPWDQLSFWAVTVATNMLTYIPLIGDWMLSVIRGGNDVGSATLLNFYNFHTGILPIAMVLLMIWHFWKVRKAKGVAISALEPEIRIPSNPDLLLKELVVGLILLALIFLLSALFNAPLQERANPAFSPNPAKAPWYFMGIQELLLHIHPFFAFLVLPLVFFASLIWLPYAIKEGNQGSWFHSSKGKRLTAQAAWLALIFTPLSVLLEDYVLHFEAWLPSVPKAISEGLIPMMLLLASFGIYLGFLKKRYKPTMIELIIALFTVFVVSYTVLTIIGIWFRGEGMQLMWPWEI